MSTTPYPGSIFEPTGTIGEALAGQVAAKVRADANERKIAPEREKFIRKSRCNWPNDFGGYFRSDSRVEPDSTPLTPRERFARLAAHYESQRRSYRWKDGPPASTGKKKQKLVRAVILGKPSPMPRAAYLRLRAQREAARAA